MCVFSNLLRKLLKFYGKIKDKKEKKKWKEREEIRRGQSTAQTTKEAKLCVCVY
jgi:hypothetical protein